jgi:glycosylphosphatidylinositol transamidase (GPIT) subunit GPI8
MVLIEKDVVGLLNNFVREYSETDFTFTRSDVNVVDSETENKAFSVFSPSSIGDKSIEEFHSRLLSFFEDQEVKSVTVEPQDHRNRVIVEFEIHSFARPE